MKDSKVYVNDIYINTQPVQKLTPLFKLTSTVHTLKTLISQDETPTAGTVAQKCKFSLIQQMK